VIEGHRITGRLYMFRKTRQPDLEEKRRRTVDKMVGFTEGREQAAALMARVTLEKGAEGLILEIFH
jgi:hypothetical protein